MPFFCLSLNQQFRRWCSLLLVGGNPRRMLSRYVAEDIQLAVSGTTATIQRSGWRTLLKDPSPSYSLARDVAGQLPFFYRSPHAIAKDFAARHNFLELLIDLGIKTPTSPKFRNSHFGEILCALYLEHVLGYRRLYSKLTLTTSENTNVHKMDGFFVDVTTDPYTFIAVEAKTSILPTQRTRFSGHRHGILQQMIASLENYGPVDKRFDFVAIRDNLEEGDFDKQEAQRIRASLIPPGPDRLIYMGMATVNESTVCAEDDDFILQQPCSTPFDFRALVVADLAGLANKAYEKLAALTRAAED
jgi:hypothetical protein